MRKIINNEGRYRNNRDAVITDSIVILHIDILEKTSSVNFGKKDLHNELGKGWHKK